MKKCPKNLILLIVLSFVIRMGVGYGQIDSTRFLLTPLFTFGTAGADTGEFSQPQGIAIDPDGKVYVADTGNNRIQVFSHTGGFIGTVGSFGWNREQFNRPMAVCADNGLDVFVADYQNHRIERYDRNLNWISSFYSQEIWDEKLQFGFPADVAISKHGEIFLVDQENNRILKINSFGVPELSFGDYDWGEGYLEAPLGIALSSADLVAVTDPPSGRAVILDYFGNYLGAITHDRMVEPWGVCWLNSNCLVVSDFAGQRIFGFDHHGRVLFEIGTQGNQLGSLYHPTDLAGFKDLIYVLDAGNHRIQVFKILLLND